MMASKQWCPMAAASAEGISQLCVKEECAWWNTGDSMCVIMTISRFLVSLTQMAIERNRHFTQKGEPWHDKG